MRVDEIQEDALVHVVEARAVHFESLQCVFRHFNRDGLMKLLEEGIGLRKITAAAKKPVGDSWGTA